jgi:hypothetical protein
VSEDPLRLRGVEPNPAHFRSAIVTKVEVWREPVPDPWATAEILAGLFVAPAQKAS